MLRWPQDLWLIFSKKVDVLQMGNTPNCRTSLNDPACHPFLSNPAMEGSRPSSSSAWLGVSIVSLTLSIVTRERRSGKSGSSLSFRNALNEFSIFSSSSLWSSSVKVSRSSDIRLSAGGVEGSEEACRSPTDKCEKSLDIESMIKPIKTT
jgi:hypothetical protein